MIYALKAGALPLARVKGKGFARNPRHARPLRGLRVAPVAPLTLAPRVRHVAGVQDALRLHPLHHLGA